jgi:ABC-2 type transport system permease protein
MPLFEIGYRRYEGERTHERLRWWPIARQGWSLALRAKLLRRLMLVAYLPILYFAPVFFFIGRITDPDSVIPRGPVRDMAQEMLGSELIKQLHEHPTAVRGAVWAIVFTLFATSIQLVLAALVAAVVGPSLISQDMRSKAFLLYFSRPISSADYLLGKAAALGGLVAAVTVLPSLVLYFLSIVFSPSLSTILHTAPVLLDVVLAGLAVVVPVTLVLLTLSSLTKQARFAAIAWAVLVGFGFLFHHVIQATHELRTATWPRMCSLLETIRAAQLAAFDVPGRVAAVPGANIVHDFREFYANDAGGQATAYLLILCAACWIFLLRRVGAPTRI